MLRKKIFKPLAIALLIVFMFSTVAMAATPNNTIFFGGKAYNLSLLNDPTLASEIAAAFVANGNKFVYKTPAGGYIDANAANVDPSTLPAGTYMDADKTTTDYGAGDTEPSVELAVESVSAIADINVDFGTAIEGITFPAKVTLNLSDETTAEVDATFACDTYDGNVAGEYVFTATYVLPEGVTGDKPVATVKVVVAEKPMLAVSSVSAINAKTLQVEFNRRLTAEEQAAAVFAFKFGGNAIAMSEPTWDGTKAQFGRADAGNLSAGNYAVSITGLGDAALTGTTIVTAQTATTVTINTNNVPNIAAQAIAYTVFDQYGGEITVLPANMTTTAYNLTDATRAPAVTNISNISFALCNIGDKVRITTYVTANASATVTKDITVSNIYADSVTLGDPVLPTGVPRLLTGTAGVEIPVTITDNFGDSIQLTANAGPIASGTTLAPTNLVLTHSGVAAVAVNADGDLTFTLGAAGNAWVRVTNPATGAIVTKSFEVLAAPNTAGVALEAFTEPFRVGGGTRDITFTMTDQYGDEYTTAALTWVNTNISLSSSNTAVATVAWNVNNIRVTPVATGTTTITAVVTTPFASPTNGIATVSVTVDAAKAPTTIAVRGTPKTALANTETVLFNAATGSLGFLVTDQDGDAINLAATTAAGVKANLTVTDTNGVLTAPATAVLMAADMSGPVGTISSASLNVTAHATNVGTATVTVQLFNDANSNDTMDAGEELSATANVTYTVKAPVLTNGAITSIAGGATSNTDFSAAYAIANANQTITYALQDQAGNPLTTTAAVPVNWTITNTGETAMTVNDGTAKTLAAGATATYTTQSTVGAAATTTIEINSAAAANTLAKVSVAVGTATPHALDLVFAVTGTEVPTGDMLSTAVANQSFTGTVVGNGGVAATSWVAINTAVGYKVVNFGNAAFTTQVYKVNGNSVGIAAFNNALKAGASITITTNAAGTTLTATLTN